MEQRKKLIHRFSAAQYPNLILFQQQPYFQKVSVWCGICSISILGLISSKTTMEIQLSLIRTLFRNVTNIFSGHYESSTAPWCYLKAYIVVLTE